MKNSIKIVFVSVGVLLLMNGCESYSSVNMNNRFNEAQEILFKIVLPNSMARNEVLTENDINALISDFDKISEYFQKGDKETLIFLEEKLQKTNSQSMENGLCALQLLYEINTQDSKSIITKAKINSNESIATTAMHMIDNEQDVLWGFRNN